MEGRCAVKLEKPDLYRVAGDRLELLASRCGRCSRLSFPKARYGCPACGAEPDASMEEVLDGRARLLSFATLHAQLAPGLQVPLVVGEVEIADGIVEEVVLGCDEQHLRPGMPVQARPVPVGRNGEQQIACRFMPLEAVS